MTLPLAPDMQRRAAITARVQAETGIDDAMINRLVHGFYDQVRRAGALEAVNNTVVGDGRWIVSRGDIGNVRLRKI